MAIQSPTPTPTTYKKITKNLVKQLFDDDTKYKFFQAMIYEIRNVKYSLETSTVNPNNPTNTTFSEIQNIILGDKFKENTILMDFQMLPNDLKLEMEEKFNELIY